MSRRKLSTTEGAALVHAWQVSGQRQSVYCREHDIAIHVLQYWRSRSLDASEKDAGIGIIPVSCARQQDHVGHGTVSFCRRGDGHLSVLVTGAFDASTCRSALELLP